MIDLEDVNSTTNKATKWTAAYAVARSGIRRYKILRPIPIYWRTNGWHKLLKNGEFQLFYPGAIFDSEDKAFEYYYSQVLKHKEQLQYIIQQCVKSVELINKELPSKDQFSFQSLLDEVQY